MTDFLNKVLAWVKANILLAVVILIGVVVLFFPKLLKGLFGKTRVKHRPGWGQTHTRSGKPLPRSVGTRKPRKQYTKGGKAKKAWQIKGSLAAKRHMAQIRKMR